MLEILKERNCYLQQYAQDLYTLLDAAKIPPELGPSKAVILSWCKHIEQLVRRNLTLIELRRQMGSRIEAQPSADFVKEILEGTQEANNLAKLISAHYAAPILRASQDDRLSLYILHWLHRAHPQTRDIPPIVVNQPVSVRPFVIPIYYFPSVEQRRLLYQSLSFHEYGHVLYNRRVKEMDDLVKELKVEILDYLAPGWYRDDRFDEEQSAENQAISDTWYSWVQELFCDAVGFQIGGPSYFYAFGHFLTSFAESDFHLKPDQLRGSKHPVQWLRIRFLQRRAEQAGYTQIANHIGAEWDIIARVMQIEEDYYGYYDPNLDDVIEETIDYMLEEASPRQFSDEEASATDWNPNTDTPVQLLNWVWHVYLENRERYSEVETAVVNRLFAK